MEIVAAEAQLQALLRAPGFLPAGTPVEPAPYAGPTYPAVVYKCLSPQPDSLAVGGNLIMSTLDYLVVVITEDQNAFPVIAHVKGIEQALAQKGGTNAYGTVITIIRERPHSAPFRSESGKILQQIGYVFRIVVQGSYT